MSSRFGDGPGGPSSFPASRLRHEAGRSRPVFSPEFHIRLWQRLEADVVRQPRHPPEPRHPAREWRGWPGRHRTGNRARTRAAFLGAAVGGLVMAAFATLPRTARLPETAAADGASLLVAGSGPALGIELIPFFDEIDEGVRRGVRVLAQSLIEPPEWAGFEDFDATALLAVAASP